jgi:hypothetical protein
MVHAVVATRIVVSTRVMSYGDTADTERGGQGSSVSEWGQDTGILGARGETSNERTTMDHDQEARKDGGNRRVVQT